MTDLPVFSGTLDGTELIEIVAAPSGQTNEASGVNYQITTELLASLLIYLGTDIVIIGDGEHVTIGDPYVVQPTDSRIYINKAIASPTFILMPAASTMFIEPLVKDVAGTVDVGSEVTVSFTGGELADGNATIPIGQPYGGYVIRPIGLLDQWTLGAA